MYKALYRKYRPTNFDEITGQEIIVKTLINSIKNDKISHAYLFTGPRGTGKTSIAKILAKTLNCENPDNCIPCNKCVSCTQINNNTMTDIIEIDAASNNGVDEIREIRDKVSLVPSIGKYKIYIIDEVHMLTSSAFNALLKTLEEPPAHAIFILATTEPHKVLPTIISRCQRFDFKRIPEKDIAKRLKYIVDNEKIEITNEALNEISKICDGGMRDAISILDQVIAYNPCNATVDDVHEINGSVSNEILTIFASNLINKDIPSVLKQIDEFYSKGKNIIKITEELINYLKNVLLYKVSPDYLKNINENYKIYENISKIIDKEDVIKLIYSLNDSLPVIKNSSDPKLAMEISIIKECIIKNPEKNEKNVLKKDFMVENNAKNETVNNNTVEKNIENGENAIFKTLKPITFENKVEKQVKEETAKKNNDTDTEINHDKLKKLKEIRVNNTLAKFNKKLIPNLKDKLRNINDYLLDDKYSKVASILLDAEIKAASEKNIIFVYSTQNMSDDFNINLTDVEYFLGNILKMPLNVISVSKDEWEIIKNDFNVLKKNYTYIEEPVDLIKTLIIKKKDLNELDKEFGDIVKYE